MNENVPTNLDLDMGTVFITDKFPKSVSVTVIQQALQDSGLGNISAQEISKRGCFSRAKSNLKELGLILEVAKKDDKKRWLWQLSDKCINDLKLSISYRASFWYDIENQTIGANEDWLRDKIAALFDEYGKLYMAGDLMRLVHRIFSAQSGLLALRKHGGVYFVPGKCATLLDNVMQFLQKIGNTDCVMIPVGMFQQGQLREKALNVLIENTRTRLAEMQAEIKEMEADGKKLTGRKANNRWSELQAQIERIKTFSQSLRCSTDELIKQCSTEEMNLAVVATGDLMTAASLVQGGTLKDIIDSASKQKGGAEVPNVVQDLFSDQSVIPTVDVNTNTQVVDQPEMALVE